MHQLGYDKLLETLSKIHEVLAERGFPKGSVTISFNTTVADEKLMNLRSENPQQEAIVISEWKCSWGGCNGNPGIACCEF